MAQELIVRFLRLQILHLWQARHDFRLLRREYARRKVGHRAQAHPAADGLRRSALHRAAHLRPHSRVHAGHIRLMAERAIRFEHANLVAALPVQHLKHHRAVHRQPVLLRLHAGNDKPRLAAQHRRLLADAARQRHLALYQRLLARLCGHTLNFHILAQNIVHLRPSPPSVSLHGMRAGRAICRGDDFRALSRLKALRIPSIRQNVRMRRALHANACRKLPIELHSSLVREFRVRKFDMRGRQRMQVFQQKSQIKIKKNGAAVFIGQAAFALRRKHLCHFF